MNVKEIKECTFKIGDVLVHKNPSKPELVEVIEEGINQFTIKVKKYNALKLYVYIREYRIATEAEILRSKIKNIFIQK